MIFSRHLKAQLIHLGQILSLLALFMAPTKAYGTVPTKLLFVGEDLSVVTTASKHPESPDDAPAVVSIIDAKTISKYGIKTLGEALSMVPGFYMAQREWGKQPFLRGIPNGFLFLYDSVPMTSDSTKSIFPMDDELSMDLVKRIEIIKGPASVLWGPDAFAGVVNVVPLEGRDINGIRLRARAGTPDHDKHFSMILGKNYGLLEAFAALSLTSKRPFNSHYNVLKCPSDSTFPCPNQYIRGSGTLDDSKYLETVFSLAWKQWLKISGRWSTMKDRYVMGEMDSDKLWAAQKEIPFRFFKLEATRDLGLYNIHLNGYYSQIPFKEQLVDVSWHSNSHVYYGDLFIDRQLWDSNGLLTIGTSYRYNRITGAVLSKSFLPDYLQPGNPLFTPVIRQKDFDTNLFSIYGQVRRHWKWGELWAGLRFDDHSQYDNTISYNIGARWHPRENLNLKFLFGTAYRTPYNTQLVNREDLDPEKIQNFSLNMNWAPTSRIHLSATGFWNRIRHHVNEDPTGGLSSPNSQDIYGVEASIKWSPVYWINLWGNTTIFNNYGDNEDYRILDYIILEPDGSTKTFYSSWQTPFETGPKRVFNLGADLKLTSHLQLSTKLSYASSYTGYYNKGDIHFSTSPQWILDVTATYRDLLVRGLDAQVAIKNLFDSRYKLPGTFSTFSGEPFVVYFSLGYSF